MRAETSTIEEAQVRLGEVPPPDPVDPIVHPHIRDEHRHLHDVFAAAAGLFQNRCEVLEHLLRLGNNVALADDVARRVHRYLPRDVDGPPGGRFDPSREGPPRIGAGSFGLSITLPRTLFPPFDSRVKVTAPMLSRLM
jgi:hypothetical protein